MLKISIENQEKIAPSAAILIYRNYNINAAIIHPIKENNELGVGKNIDIATLEEIFNSADNRSTLTFLPENILAVKNNSIVWFEKSRKHKIFFDVSEPQRQTLNKLSGKEVIWPSLLFKIENNKLFCWALKGTRRPMPNTKLFVAPLTHINESNGAVCLPSGLNLNDKESIFEKKNSVSENFYNGVFGHGTGSMHQINHIGGHDGFWIEHLKTQPEKFPFHLLKSANCKLKDILQ